LIAVLRASENDAPVAAEGPGESGSAAGVLDRFEIEDSAESTPATAVISGIIVLLSRRPG